MREVQVRYENIRPDPFLMFHQEHFADYIPVLPSLFSVGHMPTEDRPLYGSSVTTWDPKSLERAVQGITAVLLSLKKKPVIRYESMSPMAKKLGAEIQVCSVSVSPNPKLIAT